MTNLFSVSGRHALVVGGTRGIGRAISLRLAAAGCRVVANYVRAEDAATSLLQEAGQAGFELELLRADVTSPKGIQLLADRWNAGSALLSILVFAAATGVHKRLEELTPRHWDWTFALNVRAFFELVQRLSPHMASGASIVSVSSEGAERAVPYYTLVGASKGALESLSRHLAAELGSRQIRVNVLSPGIVETEAWSVLPDGAARLAEGTRRSFVGRLITAEEVAWATQFLCSDAAAGVTGHTLVVDGGARVRG
jgi:NAD(P)-dependent dehydrogenase (short-subunit alcohol dehydrogenase family)